MRSGLVPPVAMIESTSPVTNIELITTGAGLSIAPELAVQRHYSSANLVKRSKVSPAIQPGPLALLAALVAFTAAMLSLLWFRRVA